MADMVKPISAINGEIDKMVKNAKRRCWNGGDLKTRMPRNRREWQKPHAGDCAKMVNLLKR